MEFIQKIQAYLIARYPQLWNTRIVIFLPIVILIHIGFYLAGYLRPFTMGDLHRWQYFNIDSMVTFSVLVTVVLVIVWLLFYLRNNPLKARYPLSKGYLIKEYLLLVLVFFSSATFFLTYQQGLYDQVNRQTSYIDLVKEVDQLNMAFHFLAFDTYGFRVYQSCDSIKAREMRQAARQVEFDDAKANGIKLPSNYVYYEPEPSYLDALPLSYLYYCRTKIGAVDEPLGTADLRHARAKSWLYGGHVDSVEMALNELKNWFERYEVNIYFDPHWHATHLFEQENFEIDTLINQSLSQVYDEENDTFYYQAYIALGDMDSSIEKILDVRKGFWEWETWAFIIYYAFSIAILLISFRMSSVRVWFASLIGAGILGIIISLIFVGVDIEEEGGFVVFIVLFASFIGGAASMILSRDHKFIAGMLLNWALWLHLLVLPFIWLLLLELNKDELVAEYTGIEEEYVTHHNDTYAWLNGHWHELLEINLIVFLLVFGLIYSALAKKWQSNPEE